MYEGRSVSYGLVERSHSDFGTRGYTSVNSVFRGSGSTDSGLERVVAHVDSMSNSERCFDVKQYNLGNSVSLRSGIRYTTSIYGSTQGSGLSGVSGLYHISGGVSRHAQGGYQTDFVVVYGEKRDNDVLFSPRIGVMQVEYLFDPSVFLKPRREGRFVGEAGAVQGFIEEAFELMMGRAFPDSIRVSVLGDSEFNALCSHAGTLGLAINRCEQGLLSDVFVRAGSLARVMLTVGHEIGHVLTPALNNSVQEEAKAFAFSFAWMDVISKYDIAGLGDSFISENPAHNGLHDVACHYVWNLMNTGVKAREVYEQIVSGRIESHVQTMSERIGLVS